MECRIHSTNKHNTTINIVPNSPNDLLVNIKTKLVIKDKTNIGLIKIKGFLPPWEPGGS